MLATKLFFSQTFSSRTSYKHIKSQQKSTDAKYNENPSFVHPSLFPVDAMLLCKLAVLQLRWLPRVSTKVTIRTGKTYKRNPSSVVLQCLFLNFTRKVTNIITLIFQFLLLGHRPLSWQQNI